MQGLEQFVFASLAVHMQEVDVAARASSPPSLCRPELPKDLANVANLHFQTAGLPPLEMPRLVPAPRTVAAIHDKSRLAVQQPRVHLHEAIRRPEAEVVHAAERHVLPVPFKDLGKRRDPGLSVTSGLIPNHLAGSCSRDRGGNERCQQLSRKNPPTNILAQRQTLQALQAYSTGNVP